MIPAFFLIMALDVAKGKMEPPPGGWFHFSRTLV